MRYTAMRVLHKLGVPPHFGGPVKQVRINGYRILVSLESDVGCQIHCFRRFEPAESERVRQVVRPGAVCMDVGANVGYYTLLLASLARNGQVHAFEPVPRNCKLLARSLELNGFENVRVNQTAVADEVGQAEFTVASDSAYSALRDTGRVAVDHTLMVPLTTLDTYVEQHGIERVDFLKVDVEGAELQVLQGARALLADSERRPPSLLLELYSPMLAHYSTSINEILAHLAAHGYRSFVAKEDSFVPFERCHHDRCWNVFFSLSTEPFQA